MKLKTIHLVVGLVGVAVFLATGVYMRVGFPELYGDHEAVRYMYRANHVYILFASLLNVVAGLRLDALANNRARAIASIGSALMLVAPVVLVFAFFLEAPKGVPERVMTLVGVVLATAGVAAHLFAQLFGSTDRTALTDRT